MSTKTAALIATATMALSLSACGSATTASPASPAASPTKANLLAYSAEMTGAITDLDAAGMVSATAGDVCPLNLLDAAQIVAELKALKLDHAKLADAYSITKVTVVGNSGTISGSTPAGQATNSLAWSNGAWHRNAPTDGCN